MNILRHISGNNLLWGYWTEMMSLNCHHANFKVWGVLEKQLSGNLVSDNCTKNFPRNFPLLGATYFTKTLTSIE